MVTFAPVKFYMAKRKVEKASLKLAELVKKGIEEKKGQEIVTLDIYKTNPTVCDYFIICHGTSNTQVSAIADEIQKTVQENLGEKPFHVEGVTNSEWILLDYVSVVVHIFQKEFRDFYDLENLWADAGQ